MRALPFLALLAAGCFDFSRFHEAPHDLSIADTAEPRDLGGDGAIEVELGPPGDGGLLDAATPGVDGGSTACGVFQGISCWGFDSVMPNDWMLATPGGTMTYFAGGRRGISAKAHVGPPADGMQGATEAQAQALRYNLPAGMLWLRAFVRVTAAPPQSVAILALVQQSPPYINQGLRLEADGKLVLAGSVNPTTSPSPKQLVFGSWHCLELGVDRKTSGMAYARIDGEAFSPVSGNFVISPPLEGFLSGAYVNLNPPPNFVGWDIDLDELAIASSPIGCTL